MTSKILLRIVSQDAKIFHGEVDHVNVTGSEGELGIYPGHSPLLSKLKPGLVSFDLNGELNAIYISGGFVEVQPKVVNILADVAIHAKELDQERILNAKSKAEQKLASASGDDFSEVATKLQREIAKLRAYELINALQSKQNKR